MVVIGRGIDELEVGQTASFTRRFCADEVERFADLTWDHNPYHLHEGFAKKARFGKPIVHGALVASAFSHFGGDFFPGPAILATKAVMEFIRPVFVDEELTFEVEIVEVDRKRGRIVFVTTASNEADETVCKVTCHGAPTAVEV